ncbi:hypothetical protein GCM10022217_35460 [Chryseobacterium ginsenosidimutans]
MLFWEIKVLKMKLFIFFIFISQFFLSQYSEKKIKTDSSEIVIIKNSKYKVREEIFDNKDYIIHKSWLIQDTAMVSSEGVMDKQHRTISWKEYTENGEWLYSRNYKTGECSINKFLFPKYLLFEKMKKKADELIIKEYGIEFFSNYVRFECDGLAYKKQSIKDSKNDFYSKYLGSWTEPFKENPDELIFKYAVKISDSEWKSDIIGIKLDKVGNYVINEDVVNNYGFEKVEEKYKKFFIDYSNSIQIAIQNGLNNNNVLGHFLDWEKINPKQFYSGRFIYCISELISEENYKHNNRKGRLSRYNVYVFNPWTGKFIEKRKMKSIIEYENNSGMSTGLIPDKN